MDGSSYASDLNDDEGALLTPLSRRSHLAGRRHTDPLQRTIDAIFYLLRTGAQCRMLPHQYPPRFAIFYHDAQWRENGLRLSGARAEVDDRTDDRWLTTNRRLAKDDGRLVDTGEMLLYLAMSCILLRRLAQKGER
jgi:transposase